MTSSTDSDDSFVYPYLISFMEIISPQHDNMTYCYQASRLLTCNIFDTWEEIYSFVYFV